MSEVGGSYSASTSAALSSQERTIPPMSSATRTNRSGTFSMCLSNDNYTSPVTTITLPHLPGVPGVFV